MRSCRFEELADAPAVGLADLKSTLPLPPAGAVWDGRSKEPELILTARPGDEHLGLTFALPYVKAMEALHVRLRMSSRDLVKGKDEWEDARIMIRWNHPGDEGKSEIDPVASAFGDDGKETLSVVVQPSLGEGTPTLMIENLAESGEVRIADLELRPVRQRDGWAWLRLLLGVGWFLWIVALLSGSPRLALPRRYAAAGVWIALGIFFAFPGPWQRLTPLVIPFDLKTETVVTVVHQGLERDAPPATVKHETEGKIQAQDGLILRLRYYLKPLRPLLHIAFPFAVAAGFLLLVGERRAAWLAAGIVLAMEGSQLGFGYGFDSKDVLDLVFGAVGIFLAIHAFRRLRALRWMPAPLAKLFPPTVARRLPDQR